jgi:hypothetical protein
MADINSSISQLVGAFKKHYKNSTTTQEEISHWLLLFYAIECGLKAKYLRDKKLRDTADFESAGLNKHGYGHHITEWQRQLKLPNFGYEDDKTLLPIVQMHERLRYGIFGSSAREKEQIKYLKDLAQHIKGKI